MTTPPEAAACCGAVVRAASFILSELNSILKPFGLSEPSFNALRILRGGPNQGLTCGQIGDRLVSRGPDVTRLINRLERSGLVRRKGDAADKRIVLVTIRAAGRDLLAKLDAPVDKLLSGFWQGVPPKERTTIAATLQRLSERD